MSIAVLAVVVKSPLLAPPLEVVTSLGRLAPLDPTRECLSGESPALRVTKHRMGYSLEDVQDDSHTLRWKAFDRFFWRLFAS